MGTLCLTLAGCASLPGFERPDVTLVNLSIENATVFETEGRVTLRVINADENPLTVTGTSINLYLDGKKIGRAVSPERLQVDGLSTATLEAPLYISNLALGRRVFTVLTQQRAGVDYEIRGKLTLGGGFGGRKVKVNRQGLFELPEGLPGTGPEALSDDFTDSTG